MRSVDGEDEMSIAECRHIFGDMAKNCDDATIIKMRDWLYQMTGLALELVQENSIITMEDLKRVLEEKNKGKPK